MYALRRREARLPQYTTALTLRLSGAGGVAVFSADIVQNFRRMITGLQYRGSLPGRLAVMASIQGEGVTFSTLALAATLANDLHKRVCAVELNWHAPGMLAQFTSTDSQARSRWFGRRAANRPAATIPAELGRRTLAAVLNETMSIDEALVDTSLPNLKLLPAGDIPSEQRPSIARSEALAACVERLSQRFDYLIFDLPAILLTSDAVALASLAESCCLVIQQGVTSPLLAQRALDEVKHLKVLGVVLNQTQIHTPRWIQRLIPQE